MTDETEDTLTLKQLSSAMKCMHDDIHLIATQQHVALKGIRSILLALTCLSELHKSEETKE